MSDNTTVTTGSTDAVQAQLNTQAESNPVRQMREALDAKNAELKAEREKVAALEAKVKERELADLSEVERLKRENAELLPIRDEHGRFVSVMEKLYQDELSSVPEEKRPYIERLSGTGSWDTRLEAIRAAKALLPAPSAPVGTVTSPGSRSNAGDTQEPIKLDPRSAASNYFANHAPIRTANLSETAKDLKNYKQQDTRTQSDKIAGQQ